MTGPAAAVKAANSSTDSTADFFLPDFCEPRMVLAVVLVAELLALMLSIARSAPGEFLAELARVSVFVQWSALTSAAAFCSAAPRLRHRRTLDLTLVAFGLVAANVVVLSALAVAVGRWLAGRGLGAGLFPLELWPFMLRNVVIALIVTALLLRYFFVSHQWRRHVRAEASARIDALHARIRPHFLFNSLNTIASLTRSDAGRAEEAIEDLADLFRATLREADAMITLKEELELARIYQRMEALRLGDRLKVRWLVEPLPMRSKVPSLIVQPLLENAINHGIEPSPTGGTVTIEGHVDGDTVVIAVTNPAPVPAAAPEATAPTAGKTEARTETATAADAPAATATPAADVTRASDTRAADVTGASDTPGAHITAAWMSARLPFGPPTPARRGNRIALDNIRGRLALAYGDRASITATPEAAGFRVELRLPREI